MPAGQFDPYARPADGRRRALWVEFARMGHGVRGFGPCAAGLVALIDDPDRPPDPSCASEAAPVRIRLRLPAR